MIRPAESREEGATDEAEIMAEINITPLTDVFLVLLIIFMVGASVAVSASSAQSSAASEQAQQEESRRAPRERGLEVNTPEGTGDTIALKKDVIVSVLPTGEVVMDGEKVDSASLTAKLREAAQQKGSKRVIVRGDEEASYREIMDVINTARAAGLTDVALATRVQ